MTTLTSDQLDNVLGGNRAAAPTDPAQRAVNAANFKMCLGDAALARGPFPKGAPLDAMVGHVAREQADQDDCAGKYPL